METPLRILYFEDEPKEAELVQETLTAAGLAPDLVRVETRADFEAALAQDGFDLILSDNALPSFDGLAALTLARQKRPDVPFIFVSGTLGEEAALESLKWGATDYVLRDGLARLVPLVERAWQAEKERAARTQVEKERTRLSTAVEYAAEAIVITDTEGRIEYVNPAFEQITGFAPAEVIGQNPRILQSGAQDEAFYREMWATLKQGRVWKSSLVNRKRDGTTYPVEETISPVKDSQGSIINYVAVQHDISPRIHAEEALAARERRFRALIENTGDAIVLMDAQGTIVYASPSTHKTFGMAEDPLVGMNAFQSLHPDDFIAGRQLFARLLENPGVPFPAQFRFRHRDGAWRWIESTLTNLLDEPAVNAIVGNYRDITQRRQVEERIARLAAIVESSDDAIIGKTLDGTIVSWNQAAQTLFGYSADEVLGHSISIIIPPDRLAEELKNREQLERGERVEHFETVRLKKGNEAIDVSLAISPIKNESGQIIGASAIARDIGERKRLEAQLHQLGEDKFDTQRSRAARDLVMVAALAVLVFGVSTYFGISQKISTFIPLYATLDLNELLLLAIFLVLALGIFSSRRWNEVREQVVIRTGIEETLRRLHGELERRVHERTTDLVRVNQELRAEIVERRRAQEEVRRQANEFAALYETANDLAKQTELTSLLQTIVQRAMTLLGVSGAGLHFYDPARRELELVVAEGAVLPVGSRVGLGEGIAGHVAETRQPVIVNDYPTSPLRPLRTPEIGLQASLQVPMLYQGELTGVLVLNETRGDHPFSDAEASLLSLFASQAASAVHNARLLQETRTRAEQMALLYEAGLALNSVLDARAQLDVLYKIAMGALRADHVSFFRYDPVHRGLKFESGVNDKPVDLIGLHEMVFPLGEPRGLVGWIAEKQTPFTLPDTSADPRWLAADPSVRSAMWAPVVHEQELFGVMNVASTQVNAFSPQDQRLLVLFANQISVAMQNARLFEETQRQVNRLRALRAIDRAIIASGELQVTLDVLLGHVLSELRVDAADVLRFNPDSLELEYAAGRGMSSRVLTEARVRRGTSHVVAAALRRKIVVIPNLADHGDAELRRALADENFVFYLAAPLVAKGQVMGVLELFQRAPFQPGEDWLEFMQALADQAAITIDNGMLFEGLRKSNLELGLAYETTLEGWSRTLDLRDKETEGHTQRVTEMTMRLARRMGLEGAQLVHIRRGSLLHDIGKMGVPDQILFKQGPLTDKEWEIMRKHPVYAYEVLSSIAFLRPALDIPYCHHEKWDGTGYPRGLKGEQIPLAARLFAVVDVWDALRSERPYRGAWPAHRVREYIQSLSGSHLDPQVVQAFIALES